MKKKALTMLLVSTMAISSAITSFAGTWKQDTTGWWYQNDDGSFQHDCWFTDTNGKQYYFNSNGYMLCNATTPDGKTVGTDGVLIATAQTSQGGSSAQTSQSSQGGSSTQGTQASQQNSSTVWLPATGKKYHSISNCGKMNPNKATQTTVDHAIAEGYEPCDKCFQ